jgi:hypothetical protein
MSRLTGEGYEALRWQIATLKPARGSHRKYLPYAFTEQGVAMLSSLLRSQRAIDVNVEIMRTFVRLQQLLASNAELARRLDALEDKYDAQFQVSGMEVAEERKRPDQAFASVCLVSRFRADLLKLPPEMCGQPAYGQSLLGRNSGSGI